MTLNGLKTLGAALACSAVLLLGSVATAQNEYAKRVDIKLKDADLKTATAAVTLQTGIKFVIADSSAEFKLINLSLADVTAEQAIEYICTAAGATWHVDYNGVYIIKHKADALVAAPTNTTEVPVRAPKRVQRIKLMKADPYHVYNMLVNPERVIWKDSIELLNQEATNRISQNTQFKQPALVMVGNGTQNVFHPYAPDPKPTQPVNNGIQLPDADPSQNGTFVTNDGGAAQVGGLGGGQGGGGLGGGQGGGGLGGGQQGQGGTGSVLDLPGQGFMPPGITRVTYDPTDNSLIVQGDDAAIRELELLIAQFDVAPKQVIIKVEFITTSTSLDKALGIDWFYQRGSVFAGVRPGTFARAADPIFLNYATGNISTRLRTLLTEGWGRTVTSPLVRTLNNQTASILNFVQTTIFINTVTSGPGGIVITPNPFPLTATTSLTVTPRINGDQTITVFIAPSLQGFGQLKRGPDGQEIPDVLVQQINVVARVRSGETIALGGMTNKVDNYSQSRIPILSDLPIIGQLFRGRNTNTSTSELIIFVTPTIVDDENFGLGP
jgi:general secretion pathway protein D